MIKIDDRSKFMDLFADHTALNIKGILRNTDYPAYTDSLENPSGIYIADGYMNFLFTKSEAFIEDFLTFLKHDGFFGFSGTNEFVRNYFRKHYITHWESPCNQYHYGGDKFDCDQLESLKLDEAEIVDAYYEYQNDNSLKKIRDAIEHRPNSCIHVDGQLVGYVLLHDDDSIGYMYVREEFRKHGYATKLTYDILNKTIDSGRLPYIQIVHGNEKSEGLAEKTGFEKHGVVYWFGVTDPNGSYYEDAKKKYSDKFACDIGSVTTEVEILNMDIEKADDAFIIEHSESFIDDEVLYIKFGDISDEDCLRILKALMNRDANLAVMHRKMNRKGFFTL